MIKKKIKADDAATLAEIVVKGIQEKKGKDIICLNLRGLNNTVTDYFIICHGDSNTQVEAIANSVDYEVKKTTGENPWHKEGFQNAEWILVDYVNVVVHIFQKESRQFYNLEKLWADAEVVEIKEIEAPKTIVN